MQYPLQWNGMEIPDISHLIANKTCGLSITEKRIHFWADDLLHKHQINNDEDSFILMPKKIQITKL
jgi:hypothetical protein